MYPTLYLSASLKQRWVLILILLLLDGRVGEAWEPAEKESFYRTQGSGGQKILSRFFSCFEGLNQIFFL